MHQLRYFNLKSLQLHYMFWLSRDPKFVNFLPNTRGGWYPRIEFGME